MTSLKKNIFPYCIVVVVLFALSVSQTSAETYIYDPAGRLISVIYDDLSTIIYSYDNAGNLLQREVTITMNLADVNRVLEIFTLIDPSSPVYKKTDVDGDGKIEPEEVIYILQKASEFR